MTWGLPSGPPWPSATRPSRPRVCSLRMLLVVLASACCPLLLLREALKPPASSRQFARLPARVVLCIGTLGGRAGLLVENLHALINQTWKADLIIVSINKGDPASVLGQLKDFGPFVQDETNASSSALPTAAANRAGEGGRPLHGARGGAAVGAAGRSLAAGGATAASETGGRTVFRGSHGLVLQFLDKSWGPGTKLVGAYLLLGPAPDTLLVTVDDDCWYPPNLVDMMVRHLPADRGALSHYCEMPLSFGPGMWIRLDKAYSCFYPSFVVECPGWLMGFGGVAYWASSFEESLVTYLEQLPPGCFYHDDVWISGYLHEAGIKRYLLYGLPVPRHGSHSNLSIHRDPHTQARHQLPCVQHFNYFKELARKPKA